MADNIKKQDKKPVKEKKTKKQGSSWLSKNRKSLKYGGYSVAMVFGVIALVVVLNLVLTTLDSNFNLRIDFTQNRTYSISQQAKTVADMVDEDIIVYTTYVTGKEDKTILDIVERMVVLSDRITLENIDTQANPTFTNTFVNDGVAVAPGSIIVTNTSHDKYKVLDVYDQYNVSYDDSYQPTVNSITVESSMTSALQYIITDDMPHAYFLEGHGEPNYMRESTVRDMLTSENYDVQNLNLATWDSEFIIGDIIIVLAPESDLLDTERAILKDFMAQSGRLLMLFKPENEELPMFNSLLELYGVSLEAGIVFEEDTKRYAAPYTNALIPVFENHPVTNAIAAMDQSLIMPSAGPIKYASTPPSSRMKLTPMLTTSETSWLEADLSKVDGQKADDELSGPFTLGIAVELDNGEDNEDVKFIVINSSAFITTDEYLTYYANADFFLNAISWLKSGEEDIYIRGKMLSNQALYISSANTLYLIMGSIVLLILLLFAASIVVYLKRKNL